VTSIPANPEHAAAARCRKPVKAAEPPPAAVEKRVIVKGTKGVQPSWTPTAKHDRVP